ncbi:MAG: hypothetical protein ACE5K4_05240, partial [Candidatus Hydrothermarchaeota archaeon]
MIYKKRKSKIEDRVNEATWKLKDAEAYYSLRSSVPTLKSLLEDEDLPRDQRREAIRKLIHVNAFDILEKFIQDKKFSEDLRKEAILALIVVRSYDSLRKLAPNLKSIVK